MHIEKNGEKIEVILLCILEVIFSHSSGRTRSLINVKIKLLPTQSQEPLKIKFVTKNAI